ncbi:Protein P [Labeo rohita]|uniref:Protein P n=1 Tax=Labeo rohita TaxID=84645 RepID=A0ABQ8LB22_LABRO|nr:Protein P [Labeo rohita]
MAAVSNVIPFGLLFMRPLQWCLKTKGVLPEGKPALHDQGHAAMPTYLGHVEKTLVLVSGPGAGSSLSPLMLATDASLIGWGVVMSGPPARGLWSGHHPVWHFSCLEMLAALLGKGVVHRILRCPSLLGALGRLACQPCRCFRAQRSPASPHLSLPPGNVAELGSSPPLWGSLQQLVRLSPAGHPLQDTKLAAQTIPEASLERLVPLVDYLAAWNLLPNVSAWLLRTVERGYRIQFGAPPPPFNGVSTVVSPEQGLGVRVLQPVLHCSVEGWGSAFLFRSETTESLSNEIEVQNVDFQASSVTDQEVPEVCFHGRSLPVSGSSVQPCTLPPHLKELGLRLNAKKSVLSPILITTNLGMVWDSTTMQARLSPARIESILTAVTRVKEGRSLTGSDGSCVQRDTFWPAVHETPSVVAQDQGVLPEGKPILHDQGHTAMPTCLRLVEEALVPVSGPAVRSSLSPRNASDGCVSHRLGCSH